VIPAIVGWFRIFVVENITFKDRCYEVNCPVNIFENCSCLYVKACRFVCLATFCLMHCALDWLIDGDRLYI